MSSRILLVTRLGSAFGVSGHHEGLAVADIRHPDAVETALADIHAAEQRVVVTGTVHDVAELHVIVNRAKVRIPGLRAAVEPLPGNPLAVAAVSSLADDIDDDTAWLHAVLDDLSERVWSATWLTKISQLTQPNPTVWQQMRSWLPGAAYLAEQTPTPRVSIAAKEPLTVSARHENTVLLHTPADSWVVGAIQSALGSTSSSPMAPLRDVIDSYGTEDAIEFVAIPEDFSSRAASASEHAIECRACGARHSRATCPYCLMTASPSQGAPQ